MERNCQKLDTSSLTHKDGLHVGLVVERNQQNLDASLLTCQDG